jgi:plasmid stability protein
MPTLQVRNLPKDVYEQLSCLAEREHRSLTQETIVLLKEGIETRLENQERRRTLMEKKNPFSIDSRNLPDPVTLIRKDRIRPGVLQLRDAQRVDKDQVWFWTSEWQKKEQEADQDIKRGLFRSFKSPSALKKYLGH